MRSKSAQKQDICSQRQPLTLFRASCFAVSSAVITEALTVSGFIAPKVYVNVSPITSISSSLTSRFSKPSVLTNDQPQTDQRRNNQEDVRDNSIPLLPASQSDADSHPDQRVCESKQHPLRHLRYCQIWYTPGGGNRTHHDGLAGDPHGEAYVTSSRRSEGFDERDQT